jgi:hypothetical protein
MPIAFGLSLLFSGLMCLHVVRTGRELYWIFIILIFPGIGGLIYFATQVLPELMGGRTARRIGQSARETLDPTRAYREARAACEDTPTVGNKMRLAAAAFDLGHLEEAERLYAEAAQGVHEEDPALLMGRAQALVELDRFEEALPILHKLGELGEKGRTPQAALAMGRCYHAMGKISEADDALAWAAERMPGLEASARYAVFLNEVGREDEAREILTDLEKRVAKASSHFRREARHWRDFAAESIRA